MIKKFFSNRDGNVAVTASLMLVVIGVAAGAAVDYSRITHERSNLQKAIDAAVLTAAVTDGENATREDAGRRLFNANYQFPCSISPEFEFTDSEVTGTAACTIPATLLGMVGYEKFEVSVEARAGFSSNPGFRCIHALNASSSDALIYNNKRGPLMFTGDSIIAPECDVQVNSNSTGALFIKEDEGYQFARHCIVGGVDGNVNELTPLPDPSCKTSIPDPLAAKAMPTFGSCMTNGSSISGNTITFNPGRYCSGMSSGQQNIVLNPGVYHITGGGVQLTGNGSITGNGITLVMHPGSGDIEIESQGHINLSGSASGEMAGFLIFDRNSIGGEHLIKTDKNDTSSMALEGVIYAPEDLVELFWKRAGVGANEKPLYFNKFGVVADTIDLHGYNQLYITPPDVADIPELASSGGLGNKVRLLN